MFLSQAVPYPLESFCNCDHRGRLYHRVPCSKFEGLTSVSTSLSWTFLTTSLLDLNDQCGVRRESGAVSQFLCKRTPSGRPQVPASM